MNRERALKSLLIFKSIIEIAEGEIGTLQEETGLNKGKFKTLLTNTRNSLLREMKVNEMELNHDVYKSLNITNKKIQEIEERLKLHPFDSFLKKEIEEYKKQKAEILSIGDDRMKAYSLTYNLVENISKKVPQLDLKQLAEFNTAVEYFLNGNYRYEEDGEHKDGIKVESDSTNLK